MTVRLIDLSHVIRDGQDAFPGDPSLRITRHTTVAASGVNVAELRMGTHHGTHLDAPFHCYEDGAAVADIPLDRFYGPAVLIDLAPGGLLPPRAELGIRHFSAYEDAFRRGARVILRTGCTRNSGRCHFIPIARC